jgi:acyl transferase domain-containing protein
MRKQMTVFMFSGQGSQYYQMGRELFERNEVFRQQMRDLDAIVERLLGISIVKTLYDPSRRISDPFDRLRLTSPALFMLEYALVQVLISQGIEPDYALGVSLGTITAAAVAGCIDPNEALSDIVNQSCTIERCCLPGGMIAILFKPSLYSEDVLRHNCELAAVNSSTHFVVAATSDRLGIVEAFLRERNITYQRLPVPYAFHSRWIDEAQKAVTSDSKIAAYKPARIPIVCCANVGSLEHVSKDYFWQVLRMPIRFADTIRYLETTGSYCYIDLGPSGSLAAVMKYALPGESISKVLPLVSPFGQNMERLQTMAQRFAVA